MLIILLVTGLSETKEPIDNIPFLKKFIELQSLMIKRNSRTTKPHSYQSSPTSWLFLSKGILFWKNIEEKQQIYLLGNPISWALSVISIFFLIDRKSTRLNSSHSQISYAVFCLKKKKRQYHAVVLHIQTYKKEVENTYAHL